MKGLPSVAAAIFGIWLCAILQVAVAPRLAIGLGLPDFGLILVASLGLFFDRRGLTFLGFGIGWIGGALSGVNLTLYVITRATAAFGLGSMLGVGVQKNPFVAASAAVGITLVAQLLMLFFGVRHGSIIPYLAGTLITAIYDGVFASAVFAGLNTLLNPHRNERY